MTTAATTPVLPCAAGAGASWARMTAPSSGFPLTPGATRVGDGVGTSTPTADLGVATSSSIMSTDSTLKSCRGFCTGDDAASLASTTFTPSSGLPLTPGATRVSDGVGTWTPTPTVNFGVTTSSSIMSTDWTLKSWRGFFTGDDALGLPLTPGATGAGDGVGASAPTANFGVVATSSSIADGLDPVKPPGLLYGRRRGYLDAGGALRPHTQRLSITASSPAVAPLLLVAPAPRPRAVLLRSPRAVHRRSHHHGRGKEPTSSRTGVLG
jgi:hypothetical protein